MRYVKLTSEQSAKISSRELGFTSGQKDKNTGKRENITFCSSTIFVKAFGHEVEREFITI